ncbi:MAG: hypothetical protein JWM62_134 [Frankiales bacterium]|nr:hypothetical protein [Frankiales bacterium]
MPPAGRPAPAHRYRASPSLRRLLFARAPRCEWPGCGARAVRCDVEHDVAWPDGPTCSCNTGPCCRRHHRVKQEGWTKQRGDGVTWTAPSGRQWLSPIQHEPPAAASRAADRCQTDVLVGLSPTELDEELWRLLGRPDDPEGLELRTADVEPDALAADQWADPDTSWTLDLQNPFSWLEPERLPRG